MKLSLFCLWYKCLTVSSAQDFVKNMIGKAVVWIGLTDSDAEGKWKWVDGTNMTSRWENTELNWLISNKWFLQSVSYHTERSTEHLMLICIFSFWGSAGSGVPGVSAEPNGGRDENCAVTVPVPQPGWGNLVGWLDIACSKAYQWICEKSISQLTLP